MPLENPLCSGLLERIGLEGSAITHKVYKDGDEKL
jgi:acetate kinase